MAHAFTITPCDRTGSRHVSAVHVADNRRAAGFGSSSRLVSASRSPLRDLIPSFAKPCPDATHRAVADKKLPADLRVGIRLPGQPFDVQLLGRELRS